LGVIRYNKHIDSNKQELNMEYAIAYVAVIFVLQAIAAVRTPREDCQVVIFATVFWPLMIVLISASFALEFAGIGFDMTKGAKLFGARKATNPNVRGFAITLFYVEFQMWRKA
jgi:hypothetical protein